MTSLALVIPCHNEAARLRTDEFLSALERFPFLTFCFVDDGSTDATAETLAFLAHASPAIDAIYLPKNIGKAEAVRAGVRHVLERGTPEAVGFWDADLATPFDELPAFISAFARDGGADAVIGARWKHLGGRVARSVFRSCTGMLMKQLIRLVLRAPVYDTQCGAKIFTRATAEEIFRHPFISPWLFDVELLKRLGKERLSARVREVPLDVWHDIPGSNLRLTDSFRLLGDLVRIAALPNPAGKV